MQLDEHEQLHLRRVLAAWRRPPGELWLVANSIGGTEAADFVRRLYSTLTPLAERLTTMLDSGDERDCARVAEMVYRIQTSVAGAYRIGAHRARTRPSSLRSNRRNRSSRSKSQRVPRGRE
jgi:protein subunit release factor B